MFELQQERQQPVPQFYIGRLVLGDPLASVKGAWRRVVESKGSQFRVSEPLALRQLDLRTAGCTDEESACKLLNQIPPEQRAARHTLWTAVPFVQSASNPQRRHKSGLHNRSLSVVLRRQPQGASAPGILAAERVQLHNLSGVSPGRVDWEGKVVVGKSSVPSSQEFVFGPRDLMFALVPPIQVQLGELVLIPERPPGRRV